MASKRMIAKSIVDSDNFLEMPTTAQLLYFHLLVRGDDEGFIDNPRSIMRNVRCTEDDMRILIAKQYIIPFESGIVVIKHWKIHNYIRKDRLKATEYVNEKAMLSIGSNDVYELTDTCQSTVSQSADKCQHRLVENRLDKNSIDKNIYMGDKPPKKKKTLFIPPTKEEIEEYIQTKIDEGKMEYSNINIDTFFNYYNEADWHMSNGRKIKSWKQCLVMWANRQWNTRPVEPPPKKIVYVD